MLALQIWVLFTGNTHIYNLFYQTLRQGGLKPNNQDLLSQNGQIIHTKGFKHWCYHNDKVIKIDTNFHHKMKTDAFLVLKDSCIIFEKYFNRHNAQSLFNPWSISKSIIFVLLGKAMLEGKIKSLNQPVKEFLPELESEKITFAHLLNMSSGLSFDENYNNPLGYPAKALYGNHLEKRTLEYEAIKPAGQYLEYKSGNTQIITAALERIYQQKIGTLAEEKLWQKIGANSNAFWNTDQDGTARSFCCFHSSARDLLAFGNMIMQGGIANQDTFIPRDWLQKIVYPAQLKLGKDTSKQNNIYSMHWWTGTWKFTNFIYSRGYDGQYLIIFPSLKIIILRLGNAWEPASVHEHPKDLWHYIEEGIRISMHYRLKHQNDRNSKFLPK